jgi:hypothetical protein
MVVADTANSRMLAWHREDIARQDVSHRCAPARLLAGQPDWSAKGDNRWQTPARDSLCWPYGVCSGDRHAIIADAGNNRVLLWRWSPVLEEAAA